MIGGAAALAGAAVIHLFLTPEHFEEHVAYGAFFLVAAAIQLVVAVGLWCRASVRVARVAVLSSLGLIGVWMITRTVVPPLSPEAAAEPVDLVGVVASGLELTAIVLLAARIGLTTPRRRWVRVAVAATTGVAFAGLFLFASGALSYVSVVRPAPSIEVWNPGVTATTPLLYGMLLPHIWLVGSWATLSLTVSAGLLVAANVAQLLASDVVAMRCHVPRRAVAAATPLFVGVSSCCGAPAALFLGASGVGLLYRATPWVLLATVVLLAANLIVSRRPHNVLGAPPARRPRPSPSSDVRAGRR